MLYNQFQYNSTQSQTPGTLNTAGFYNQPAVPRNSQAGGINGTDGRAYTGNVQGDELVENRLGNLLSNDSRYIQNARNRGIQAASRRGLGNSSISGGASERSAIEAAMPIASQDAQTYLQTRMQNQGDLNSNLMQERDITNRMLEADMNRQASMAQADQDRSSARQARELQLRMQREGYAFQGEQAGLDRQQQEFMSRLGYDQDLGQMGAGYGYDIGRQNNQSVNQEWLSSNQYNRDLYGNFALNAQNADLRNSSTFYQQLGQSFLNDPETFDPRSLSGINNFFSQEIFGNNFAQMIQALFGRRP